MGTAELGRRCCHNHCNEAHKAKSADSSLNMETAPETRKVRNTIRTNACNNNNTTLYITHEGIQLLHSTLKENTVDSTDL